MLAFDERGRECDTQGSIQRRNHVVGIKEFSLMFASQQPFKFTAHVGVVAAGGFNKPGALFGGEFDRIIEQRAQTSKSTGFSHRSW